MSQMRSSLARFAGSMRDPDPDGARHLAADLFKDTGFIIIHPDWIDSWGDRELMKAMAGKALKDWGKK